MLLDRTFHPDEANQAFTVGKLLETGTYTYKPSDHHGPTLYYAAASIQKAFGHTTTADLDGTLLRCTPLFFAVLSLIFLFLTCYRILKTWGLSPSNSALCTLHSALKNEGLSPLNSESGTRNKEQGTRNKEQGTRNKELGTRNKELGTRNFILSLIPVALLATSPIFVFFATDFIQEMLLVCFTLMMAWAATGYFNKLRIKNSELRIKDSELESNNSKLRIKNSELRIKDSESESNNSKLRIKDSELRIKDSESESNNSKLRIKDSELESNNSKLRIKNSELRIKDSELESNNSKLRIKDSESESNNSKFLILNSKFKPGTWALLFGIAAGLAFATKETSLITFAALAATILCTLLARKIERTGGHPPTLSSHQSPIPNPTISQSTIPNTKYQIPNPSISQSHNPTIPQSHNQHLILATIAFILTAITLYSSFCKDWSGVYNAFIVAPLNYLGRAAGDAAASEGANWHIHPWYRHLKWLFIQPTGFNNIPALVCLFALALIFPSLKCHRNSKSIFWGLSLYTVIITTIYSVIPYKTPWCTLQLTVPLLLTVSFGIIILFDCILSSKSRKTFLILNSAFLIFIIASHVPGLIKLNNDPDAGTVPYNYAHASPEAEQLAKCAADAVAASSDPKPFIAVAVPPSDTWPFPWYNRKLESITGYWKTFNDLVELQKTGAKPTVVIVPMSEGHLVQPLFPHLRHTKRFYMRPRVRMRIFW